MTETTASAPGSPVWVDLGVPDLAAVQGFYTALFGWQFEDMGPGYGNYHMITHHGAHVGGAMSMPEDEQDQPAAWTVYLKTEDIERSLTDTAAAGGNVIVPAMLMPGLGSLGIVITPGGEGLGLWQSDGFDGFVLGGTIGAPVWFEVMSFDYDADAEYYGTVWGWELTPVTDDGQDAAEDEQMVYANNRPGKAATAGLCQAPRAWFPEGTSSFWRAYLSVEATDAAAGLIRAQGGTVLDGPVDTPFGRLASVADPAGATFQIVQLPGQ